MKLKTVSGITLTLILIGMLTSALNIAEAQPPATEWTRTYGGVFSDYAWSVVETSDGGYLLAGVSRLDAWLVKVDSSGNHQWNKTYGGANDEGVRSVVQTSDGGYALAGYTEPYGGFADFWLVKVDPSGNHQWNKTYGGALRERASSVVETGDGGYALAGYTESFGTGNSDFWLVKVDSSGNHQWNKTYGGASYESASSVVQTGDGGYALAGHTWSFGAGPPDFWLVKVDPSGNHQWNKTYGGAFGEGASSVVETGDGGYALAGYTESFGTGAVNFWLVKVDSSGNHQWNKTYGGAFGAQASSVVQTSDGGYALAGFTILFFSLEEWSADFWLVKVDSSGNHQWNKTYGGANDDCAHSVVQTSDGGYALAGYTESFGAGAADFWLVKVARSEYALTIYSSPTGVPFTVDGVPRTTPWSETYSEGASVSLVMPQTHGGYAWSHWLEDGDPNRIKTVTMNTNITLTGVFTPVPPPTPVGGKATPINKAIIKPELQTPWIWLTTILLSLVATIAYFKKRKRHTRTLLT